MLTQGSSQTGMEQILLRRANMKTTKYPNIVEFEVTGDYGLFSDPITRAGGEKCSYQIPTYEALKGIMASIYWKPTLIWVIDQVRVMNRIQTEVKGIRTIKYSEKNSDKKIDLSYYTYLKQCRYQVRAHFEWNMNRPELAADRIENKHHDKAKKMVRKGGRRDVFLGTRECQAYVKPCVFGAGPGYYDDLSELAFGLMYHGITYADEAWDEMTRGKMTANFWYPVMRHGVISFPTPWDIPPDQKKTIREMNMKVFRPGENFTGLLEFGEV